MNLLTPDARVAVLARLVRSAPGQKLGRTQLMKLLYFLQELRGVPLGYEFRLFTYGPFDSEVLSDLSSACGQDAVVEKTVLYTRGYGYDITPGPAADDLSRVLDEHWPDAARRADEVARTFGDQGAAELELRSTILFIDRELSRSGPAPAGADLAARVRQVKPHFSQETVLQRIAEMKARGWLTCSADGRQIAPVA